MRTLLVIVGGILLACVPMEAGAQAQRAQATPKQDSTRIDMSKRVATRQTDALKTELDLDTAQYRKMLDANARLMTERQEMWQAEAQIHEQNMEKVQKDMEDAYKKILTADQLKKWQDMNRDMEARRAEHFRRPGGFRPDGNPHHTEPEQGNDK